MTDNDVKTFLLDVQLRGSNAVHETFLTTQGELTIRFCLSHGLINRHEIKRVEFNIQNDWTYYFTFEISKKGLKYVSMH